ncbi:leukocyte cysteine proteinase inhibitor 1-like [Sceloporus undulatus]|uniref:leukocyte cysteine proteinase inhibitor 1-like n=1 Tax=Sceloporus undulatus TaxID=8520 RepID=UPI001C4BBB23|nr:leukocyte cysteine proteinase inhibitor 1-like [Sceloporus undulatus]
MLAGGLSPTKPATPEVQAITSQMKGQLEAKVNQNYSTFEAISYRPQVVAGTNYFIKVRVGDGESDYVHLRVFRALPVEGGQVELAGYQLHKTKDDPITYF